VAAVIVVAVILRGGQDGDDGRGDRRDVADQVLSALVAVPQRGAVPQLDAQLYEALLQRPLHKEWGEAL
jgi:hypothetical protein